MTKVLVRPEMEYGSALRVDEENIRANFGLGLTYLERVRPGNDQPTRTRQSSPQEHASWSIPRAIRPS